MKGRHSSRPEPEDREAGRPAVPCSLECCGCAILNDQVVRIRLIHFQDLAEHVLSTSPVFQKEFLRDVSSFDVMRSFHNV